MTREEAKKFKWFNSCREEIYNHIDQIYNDFESRVCENCKFLAGKDKLSECTFGYLPKNLYEFEFGCNQFKRNEG